MTDLPEPLLTLDALGRLCPQPVIMLARRIGEVPPGAVVAVLADDEAARLDIPAWCELRGHSYVGAEPVAEDEPVGDVGATSRGRRYLVRRRP